MFVDDQVPGSWTVFWTSLLGGLRALHGPRAAEALSLGPRQPPQLATQIWSRVLGEQPHLRLQAQLLQCSESCLFPFFPLQVILDLFFSQVTGVREEPLLGPLSFAMSWLHASLENLQMLLSILTCECTCPSRGLASPARKPNL